jgi:hypothetical protein
MSEVSVTPDSLEQVQSSIIEHFGASAKTTRSPLRFGRSGKSVQLSLVPHHDVKLEMNGQIILIQVKARRLRMNLEAFHVRTEFQGQRLCLRIESDPKIQHRLLHSTWRDIAETKHPVFLSRWMRFVRNLEEDLSSTRIEEASAAPTDFEVVLDALNASPKIGQLASEDPFLAAKLRGLKRKQQILEHAGGTFTSGEVAEAIGISRQAVDKRRLSNQLLAITQGKRGYGYPRFQFDDGKTLCGLEQVLNALKALDPWMQLIFFASPNERLGGITPIESLRSGRVEAVAEAAQGYGEQGAS